MFRTFRVAPLALFPILALAACARQRDDAQAPTGEGPVSREDLLGTRTCRATGPSRAAFRWEFRESEFTIARDGGRIPAEVLAAVAGRPDDAARVEGRWALDDGSLVLRDLVTRTDDGRAESAPDAALAPFRTPVVRFDFGGTQYVLGPAQ